MKTPVDEWRASEENELIMKQNTMWLKPPAEIGKLEDVWAYARSIDGYEYAKERWGVECGEIANSRLANFWESGAWEGTFEELRCCLFFEWRRDVWGGGRSPLVAIMSLYWTMAAR